MSAPVAVVRERDSAWQALVRFTETGLRHLVVLDDVGNLVGVLDDRRVLARWPLDAVSMHRTTVGELVRPLRGSPGAPLQVHAESPLSTAAVLMLRFQVDGLPVVDDEQGVVGMVTGSDLVRALVRIAVEEDEQVAHERSGTRRPATDPPSRRGRGAGRAGGQGQWPGLPPSNTSATDQEHLALHR